MANLHYTEKFYSIQGEGRYVGVPSIFLRMFGCNFRCRNFGRFNKDILGVETTHNPEVAEVIKNIDLYKSLKELPLVSTGCDSYSAIYPEFKRFVFKETADELVKGIVDLLPYKEWRDEHLVITGGEPLLGWQKAYPDLLNHPDMSGLKELTFETNGTQSLTHDFKYYLNTWKTANREITFSVSPKLSCSGENPAVAINPEIVSNYQLAGYTYLKFVVSTEADVAEALEVIRLYRAANFQGPVYLMPVGGVESVYHLNNKKVALLAMKHGLRYSDRLQVPLFRNQWGT